MRAMNDNARLLRQCGLVGYYGLMWELAQCRPDRRDRLYGDYTDAQPSATDRVYQVRAVKLTTTASGSYTNISQGSFATLP